MTVGWLGFVLFVIGFLLLAIVRRELGFAFAVLVAGIGLGIGLGLLLAVVLMGALHWNLV